MFFVNDLFASHPAQFAKNTSVDTKEENIPVRFRRLLEAADAR